MPTLNYSDIYFSLAPRSYATQTLNSGGLTYDVFDAQSSQLLYSANQDMNVQVLWKNTGLLQDHEGTGTNYERVQGDLVNVLFDVYEQPCFFYNQTVSAEWVKICTIKKSKDVPVRWSGFKSEETALAGHRFTLNIAPILNNLLSYSLTPPGIGTWGGATDGSTGPQDVGATARNVYGGLNGQWKMNTVVSTSTADMEFNFEANGTCRRIYVAARFELFAADGSLELCTSPSSRSTSSFWIYNGAPQIDERQGLGGAGNRMEVSNAADSSKMFMTDSPNGQNRFNMSPTVDPNLLYFKKISPLDTAEFLQWWQRYTPHSGSTDLTEEFALKVESSSSKSFASTTTVYLVDFINGRRASITGNAPSNYKFDKNQLRTFQQNVSPAYINQYNNGSNGRFWNAGYTSSVISSSKPYYRVSVHTKTSSTTYRNSEYRYYELDLSNENQSFSNIDGFERGVKFMWLNRLGGIDSYTAKRGITSSLDVEQETITKQTPYSRFLWNYNTLGYSESSRVLADMYPHEREVLNVNANNSYSVFTDPLNAVEGKWMKSLLTSPNVWVVKENTRQEYIGNSSYMDKQRPGDSSYVPVLITNSSSVLIDENKGLSQLQIDFVESVSVNTQNN